MMNIKQVLLISICVMFIFKANCFCLEAPTSQITNMEESLRKDQDLRERIAKGQRVLIKKIIIKGATLVGKEQLEKVTQLYQERWLYKTEIQSILDSIRDIYKENKYKISDISYRVYKSCLLIRITELSN